MEDRVGNENIEPDAPANREASMPSSEAIDAVLMTLDLEGVPDQRSPGDKDRKARFVSGWGHATQGERQYRDQTLAQVTWMNLGYRFGLAMGCVIERWFTEFMNFWLRNGTKKISGWIPAQLRC